MIITQVLGALSHPCDKQIDELFVEWFETNKRIQHLTTTAGEPIVIRFMGEGQVLKEGDILFEDEQKVIVVRILPCKVIVLEPKGWLEMGSACYEVGNKHMPVYIDGTRILMPYEEPMYQWLAKNGYNPTIKEEALIHKLTANVEHHHHSHHDHH